jgi:hypothetical protein
MPAYVWQCRGYTISKKEAIERKKELFDDTVCALLDKCSLIRTNWDIVMDLRKLKILKVASYVISEPNFFRFISKRFSPGFPKDKFTVFTEKEVSQFIIQINRYANNK